MQTSKMKTLPKVLPMKKKQALKWNYNKTRQRWSATHDGAQFFIVKMKNTDAPYRFCINIDESHSDRVSYLDSYVWEFKYLKSAKKVAWLFAFG